MFALVISNWFYNEKNASILIAYEAKMKFLEYSIGNKTKIDFDWIGGSVSQACACPIRAPDLVPCYAQTLFHCGVRVPDSGPFLSTRLAEAAIISFCQERNWTQVEQGQKGQQTGFHIED